LNFYSKYGSIIHYELENSALQFHNGRNGQNQSQSGNQAIRQSGNQAIRQSGNQAIRQSGNQAIRQSGNYTPNRLNRVNYPIALLKSHQIIASHSMGKTPYALSNGFFIHQTRKEF
jgi:hypothetical protein